MKFEIINPSDEAYIEGEFKLCCLATLLFGEGKYSLKQVDGDLEMPILMFGGLEDWLKKTFDKSSLDELFDDVSPQSLGKTLLSVHLARERTSLNNFTEHAHTLGKQLLSKKDGKTGCR